MDQIPTTQKQVVIFRPVFIIQTGMLLTLYHTVLTLRKTHFENIVGKGENVDNGHFLLLIVRERNQ